jgi:hypothetical protein
LETFTTDWQELLALDNLLLGKPQILAQALLATLDNLALGVHLPLALVRLGLQTLWQEVIKALATLQPCHLCYNHKDIPLAKLGQQMPQMCLWDLTIKVLANFSAHKD